MKKTLILDEATWRCGMDSDDPTTTRGMEITELENEYGYRCCLGQFSLQLDKSLKSGDIVGLCQPNELNKVIPLLTKKQGIEIVDTELSIKAISINDNDTTTIEQKVKKLKSLFSRRGIKIVFRRMKNGSKSNKK